MIDLSTIQAARRRLQGQVLKTPFMLSRTLSDMLGAQIWLKFENLQFTASFKERGALNRMLALSGEERAKGVIAVSAGNHAQGVAYHAQRMGVPAVIVMPRFTPTVKVANTRRFGAEVVLEGDTFDDAVAHSQELIRRRGLIMIHPYDDEAIIAGQGTVALEMLEDQPGLDTLVIAIGGGGLISGIATAAKGLNPDIEVIGVQTERFPAMYAAMQGREMPAGPYTIAEGIAVKSPGQITRQVVGSLVDRIELVAEADIEHAIVVLLEIEKTVVEGAGAAGLAAVMAYPDKFKGRNVGLVLTGGNIDTRLLANVLLRDLARSGRLARLRIFLQDRPGALYKVMHEFDAHHVNILEIYHQRIFTNLPAKGLVTDIECEARDRAQLEALIAALQAKGYSVSQVELN